MSLSWNIEEATIDTVQSAYREGKSTVREVVQAYLDRIAALDVDGPALNSVVTVSATAIDEADALDLEYAAAG